ncbi:hypothetical protein LUZ63_012755 [Rhynchospora breviuscula]|uniref:Reverse transcriptase zinc-binding domain-containing protein n=1 Tax=Rhynchospora breviuscula TaxID=2022672 RepID=A0A9Q0C7A4_9POAL|nr:hypothetical protein LUZ63_012755 [Rhynchospora breviuscula]
MVVPVAIPASRMGVVQNLLGCPVKEFPITYLGLPLSIKKPKRLHFLPLVQAMHDRLQGWKSKFLSLGGRLVMIKAVLAAMPLHFMQVFKLPQWLFDRMDKICRAFLWKSSDTRRGGHCLVNWDACCLPKRCGGLGILHLKTQNEALLAKWIWKLLADQDSVWTATIQDLYGTTDLESLAISDQISYGLKDVLLTKPIVVASTEFNLVDRSCRWRWTTDGSVTSKSAYTLLRDPGMRSSHHSLLWKARAPLKTKIFFWLALRNRINTRENLFIKGLQVDRSCPLCQNGVESTIHLFAQCLFALQIWDGFILQGEHLTLHGELGDFWLRNRLLTSTAYMNNRDTVWMAVMWNIWKMQNAVIFEDKRINFLETVRKTRQDIRAWIDNC